MHRSIRRPVLLLICLLATAAATAPAAAAATGPATDSAADRHAACPVPPSNPAPEVDGFTVDHLPSGVGELVSSFTYEWEDVAFASRVWERGPDADGGYAVDLTVKVLRGDTLRDLTAVSSYLAEYHEQDSAGWAPAQVGAHEARLRPGAMFWSVGPGVAVEVSLDETRFDRSQLLDVAAGVRPAGQTGDRC